MVTLTKLSEIAPPKTKEENSIITEVYSSPDPLKSTILMTAWDNLANLFTLMVAGLDEEKREAAIGIYPMILKCNEKLTVAIRQGESFYTSLVPVGDRIVIVPESLFLSGNKVELLYFGSLAVPVKLPVETPAPVYEYYYQYSPKIKISLFFKNE